MADNDTAVPRIAAGGNKSTAMLADPAGDGFPFTLLQLVVIIGKLHPLIQGDQIDHVQLGPFSVQPVDNARELLPVLVGNFGPGELGGKRAQFRPAVVDFVSNTELDRALRVFNFRAQQIAMLEAAGRGRPGQMNKDPTILGRFSKGARQSRVGGAQWKRSAKRDNAGDTKARKRHIGIIVNEVQSSLETTARQRELNSTSVLTVIVVLATVTMTFGAMIAVFFVRAQKSMFWGHIQIPALLWVTTALLLASSATLEAARRHLVEGDQRSFFRVAAWTTTLAVLFLLGQLASWLQILHSGVVLANNPHSWFIFLFSGLHGLHILLGIGGLAYLLVRTKDPASGPKYQMNTRAIAMGTAIYWHYLDFLWLVLFGLLLLWRR